MNESIAKLTATTRLHRYAKHCGQVKRGHLQYSGKTAISSINSKLVQNNSKINYFYLNGRVLDYVQIEGK